MANHAFARLSKPVESCVFSAAFKSVNESRFDSLFTIEEEVEDDVTYWTFQSDPTILPDFGYFLYPTKRMLEWRHTWGDMGWWAQEFIASHVLSSLGVKVTIRDEGIDDKMKPTYHLKYPLYSDWFNGMNRSLGLPLKILRWGTAMPVAYRKVFR